LTRLDQNRAVNQIANKSNVGVEKVKNVIIWGNHSVTQVPDVSNALIVNHPAEGKVLKVTEQITDTKWLQNDFISTVQKRVNLKESN
jgi:malate/lactate dehydrogenase